MQKKQPAGGRLTVLVTDFLPSELIQWRE